MSPIAKKPRPSEPADDIKPPKATKFIHIDGSILEGGGQILRNASALAAITATPLSIHNIRAKRSNPGLRPQHLTGLQLIETLTHGHLTGGTVSSTEVQLIPGPLLCDDATGDTKTAGSCMLLAQSAVPCLLLAGPKRDTSTISSGDDGLKTKSRLILKGGTDASMAPPIGYMQHVLLPTLQRTLGVNIELELQQRGFFPKGGGLVTLTVEALPPGSFLKPINLTDRGQLQRISIQAFTAGKLPTSIADRMISKSEPAVRSYLQRLGLSESVKVDVRVSKEPKERAIGDGCGILLTAETSTSCVLGATGLGELGISAEAVGKSTATDFIQVLQSGACTDEWLQDQLIIFMALAKGHSAVVTGELTLHTRTAIAVAEAMTPAKFTVTQKKESKKDAHNEIESGGLWLIECEGAGIPSGGGTAVDNTE